MTTSSKQTLKVSISTDKFLFYYFYPYIHKIIQSPLILCFAEVAESHDQHKVLLPCCSGAPSNSNECEGSEREKAYKFGHAGEPVKVVDVDCTLWYDS